MVTRTAPLAHPALYLPDSLRQACASRRHGCTSMHFGENQLSPGSISISPLSTRHPPVLQHWWVRASTGSHPRFTLRMDSSPGFGSGAGNASLDALFRLAFAPAPRLYRRLTWPARPKARGCAAAINSSDHSTKGTPSGAHATTEAARGPRPPTARRRWVSESLSSPSRGAFHLSLTVLVPYRWPEST